MFTIVNAKAIDNHNVYITKLTVAQYNETVNLTQSVWMIQKCDSDEPTDAFKEAAYLLRGIVKAGIINCINRTNGICTGEKGKVVFIHSKGVREDFTNEQSFNLIAYTAMEFIMNKENIQKNNTHLYNQKKVQMVEFSSENI